MAQSVRFWCLSIRLYLINKLINFLDCPLNFPGHNRVPNISDIVSFQHCTSDCINEPGIAILIEGTFAGWIRRSDLPIINTRMVQDKGLTSKVVSFKLRE